MSTSGQSANSILHMRRLALIVVATFVATVPAGCGGGTSSQDLAKARAEGAAAERQKEAAREQSRKEAQLEARVKALEKEIQRMAKQPKKAASTAKSNPLSSATSCGSNLSVGSNTTCAFAQNVEDAWYSAGGGSTVVEAYSPVTHLYYVMNCTAGVPTICRGGNSAVVYIR
jgi:hypothetical protein